MQNDAKVFAPWKEMIFPIPPPPWNVEGRKVSKSSHTSDTVNLQTDRHIGQLGQQFASKACTFFV